MNNQTTLQYKWSNKVTYGTSGSHGAVAQLDDTGRGMSGNIRHPEGCLWKNNNNNNFLVKIQVQKLDETMLLQQEYLPILWGNYSVLSYVLQNKSSFFLTDRRHGMTLCNQGFSTGSCTILCTEQTWKVNIAGSLYEVL
jgi:hypothetical protein